MSGYQGYPQGRWPGGQDEIRAWTAPGNPPDGRYTEMNMVNSEPMSRVMKGRGKTYKRPAPKDCTGVPNTKMSRFRRGGLHVKGQGQEADWREGMTHEADRPRTLFVFNLMRKTTTSDLFKYFVKFGDLMKFHVFINDEGKSTGSGIVQFVNEEAAMAALAAQPHFIHKKQVIISHDQHDDPKKNERVKRSLEKHTLYVTDIPVDASEEDLCEHFSQWGNLTICDIAEKAKRTRNTKFAFISFANHEDAVKCLNVPHKYKQERMSVFMSAKWKAQMKGEKDSKKNAVDEGYEQMNKLFVTNIPEVVTLDELLEHFSMWGNLILCKICGNVNQNNNFGFVSFQEQEDALTALIMPHTLRNQRLFVRVANRTTGSLLGAAKDPKKMSAIEKKVKNCYLFAPTLSPLITIDALYEHFKTYGSLASCMIIPNGSRRTAFIAYVKEDDAARCVYDEHFLKNTKLNVRRSYFTKWGGEDREDSDQQNSDAQAAKPARPANPYGQASHASLPEGASSPRHDRPASLPRQDRPTSPPRQDRHANPTRQDNRASHSRQDRCANPPRQDECASPPRQERHANPPRQDKRASAPRQDRPSCPPTQGRHAGPLRHARPASPPRHAVPARDVSLARSAHPGMDLLKAYESPKLNAPVQPVEFARPTIPDRPAYPVDAEPPNRKLKISGLAVHTPGYKLMCYFSRWGRVEDFDVVKDVKLRPTGCAFVIFENQCDAEKAVSDKPHVIEEEEVEVTFAKPDENLPSETFSSWREPRPHETVQQQRLPESIISPDQGYNPPEVREPRRLVKDAQPRRVPEDAQPRRLLEDEQPRRLLEDAQARRLPENAKPRGLHEDAQSRRMREDAQPRRLLEESQPQRLPEVNQPRRQSTPEPLIPDLKQVGSYPDMSLVTEYECNVSGCSFKGKSEQFECHWTKIHEAKVLYLICSFCTMGCVDADELREHLDFFHGIEDRTELSSFVRVARQQERDNIHFIMPGSVTRETCMKVAEPQQKKDAKDVYNSPEGTFNGTVEEFGNHWNKSHLAGFNYLRCPKCPKTFMKKDFLLLHIKNQHQNTEIRTEDGVEENSEGSQNLNFGSKRLERAYDEFERPALQIPKTDIPTISDISSRSAGNRSMQTMPGASLSAPLQSSHNVQRPVQLPILPSQQPTLPVPPLLASQVPTQQAVPLHGQVTPFYPSTASIPKPAPPALSPQPHPASAQPPEFVEEQPPVTSQSVEMPGEDPSSIHEPDAQDLVDFDMDNVKTQEKENIQEKILESQSEPEIVIEKKASELKRSVQPGSVLALRPDWTKTLKVAQPQNSSLDKNTSKNKSSFTTKVKFIPKFDRTHPDSIRKFLHWSHIMMERLEDANLKIRRRLKADKGEGDVADGDDDEDPEEMLQLSSDEETGGRKSTVVKGTLSQAQKDMKARAQTVAQKVVADYRSTNRYTKGTAVSVISNKGHAGKGVGKQRMLDRKVLGQLFHKSTNMIRSQSKRANVGADLVQQGITWVKQHIRRMLEQNKMIKSETDEESKKASFSAKSDDRSFQQRTDKGERSKKGRRGNSDRSRKDHQQRTENRGQANEDLQRRTGNGDRSRKECQQRTGNYDHSRDKYQHRREKRGQSSEDLQLWTDNSSRSRKEFPDLKMVKEEPVEVYMDEYVNEDEEYALAYVDEDGVHVMDDGFVMGEGGHVEREVRMDEEPDDVYHGMDQGSRGDSIRSNQDVRGYRGEARSGLRNMDDPNMQMHDAEEDEYFDLGKGSFVEENEGFIHNERVVEVVNYDEHEGTFDTAWSESAEQDSRILPGQESNSGRTGQRSDRDRRLSNQRDSFKTGKSVTRGSQERGSRAHSKSSSADKPVRERGDKRNRGREIQKHTEHLRKGDSVTGNRKDIVHDGATKSQKMHSKHVDDRDYQRSSRNRSREDKASSSKTKSQYLKKEGADTKSKDQMSSGNKNERKGGDKTEGNEGNTFDWELDDINEGDLSGDGSLCEFDMDDIDMSDFVVMDEV
ncbi:uncharacterized protein [Haliotis asinina]|uniref:uncharacterized protein isoform X2 n=1 Tax=Haliotis asinina TaxID=109174 RepID=UPI003531BE14